MARLWSFDLDGVLAEPPFGWNPAINRNVQLQPNVDPTLLTPPTNRPLDRLLTRTWYRVRYVLRPPRPGALEAVKSAARRGEVIVLTGRHELGRDQTTRWLEQHGFARFVDDLAMNGSRLKSARYKEAYLRGRPAALHIDDDAATAALLARNGIPTALVGWPRNRDLDYPDGVRRCNDLIDVRALIERMAPDD